MLALADHPRLRLAFLCLLYVGQGIPYGFVTVALAAHLAARGATAAAIGGVIAMAVLPWSFKWAWGPVVDSGRLAWLGRRRPWLIIAQAMMLATAAAIALVPETEIARLGWILLLHNVFVGLQDVAVDALAVDQLEGGDRERAHHAAATSVAAPKRLRSTRSCRSISRVGSGGLTRRSGPAAPRRRCGRRHARSREQWVLG